MELSPSATAIEDYNRMRDPAARSSFCHAPSVNLNFEQTGKATACCYNRRFTLGTYPNQSIEEIWHGQRTAELRKFLKRGDLKHGCDLCQHQLDAKNYSGLRAYSFDKTFLQARQKPSKKFMPRIMEFEMSNACNLECVMCNGFFSSSIRREREKLEPMKTVYDEAFVEQLRPFLPYLIQAKFLGGEPFLNPLYYKIWDLMIEVNPATDAVITTNGTIMNTKVRNLLAELKPTISVSCDSLDPETYESIRVNAKFDQFIKNVEVFAELSKVTGKSLSFTICPMQQNWKTLPAIMRYANQHSICLGFNTVVWPREFSIKNMPKPQIKEIHSYLAAAQDPKMKASEYWLHRMNYDMYQGMVNQIELWASDDWSAGNA